MKLITTIFQLLVSIVLQILLLPFRVIKFVFGFFEKLFKILKNVSSYLIEQITTEVIK